MRKIIYIFFILLQSCFILKGQDPSFSQFYFNKLYYNPAFAGLGGGMAISLTPRLQWPNVPGSSTSGTIVNGGFHTYKASVDLDVSAFRGLGGMGLIAVEDIEGQTSLKTTMIGLPLNSRRILYEDDYSTFQVQFGGMISSMFRSIDWNKFLFSDQFDPVMGVVKQSSFWTNPSFTESSTIFPDFSAGIVFDYTRMPRRDNALNFQVGGALNHLSKPHFSFVNLENTIPRKLTLHGNITFAWREDQQLAPAIVYEKQASMQTFLMGSNLYIKSLFWGIWYRRYQNSDAIIWVAGFRVDTQNNSCWYFYYSYDTTVSKLKSSTYGFS